MKLIIDIGEETLKEVNRCGLFLNPRDKENLVNSIKHGTPIPDNTTNGDMIKHLLYGKSVITEFIHDVNISVNNNVIGQFDREWWNAPYKTESEEWAESEG